MKYLLIILLTAVVALAASCTSFDADKDLSMAKERAQIAHIIARHPDYAAQVMDSILTHPLNLNSIRSNKKLRMLMEKDSALLARMMENARLDTPWHRTFHAIMMNEKPMMGSCDCMDEDDDMQGMHGMGMCGMDKDKMKGMKGMKNMQQHKMDRKH